MQKNILTLCFLLAAFLMASAQMPAVGTKAHELNYKDPNGKEIALSSLKGHVVLIDFWASWCGPCRRNNPQVVATYKKYQNKKWKSGIKGFTVYSVSLDQDAAKWKKAIQDDGLVWANHVSDLKGWSSAGAAKYGIRAIPQTVLVDETGYVLAINPPHELVEEILNKKLASSKSKGSKKP